MELTVYLNGEFVPYREAVVPIEDRGFMFADGIYEVVRVYGGRPFRVEDHWDRFRRSAEVIRLPLPFDAAGFTGLVTELCRRNGLEEAGVYVQLTRGVAPRKHLPPPGSAPTVVGIARPAQPPTPEELERGQTALTAPDERWLLCDVKSIALLGNVLAKLRAAEAGADEAIFIRDGVVTEATAANVFVVLGGAVRTHPADRHILHGITRKVVLELCQAEGLACEERAVTAQELEAASEVMTSGTVSELVPVTRVDGRPVGEGRPGPVFRRLHAAFQRRIQAFREGRA